MMEMYFLRFSWLMVAVLEALSSRRSICAICLMSISGALRRCVLIGLASLRVVVALLSSRMLCDLVLRLLVRFARAGAVWLAVADEQQPVDGQDLADLVLAVLLCRIRMRSLSVSSSHSQTTRRQASGLEMDTTPLLDVILSVDALSLTFRSSLELR